MSHEERVNATIKGFVLLSTVILIGFFATVFLGTEIDGLKYLICILGLTILLKLMMIYTVLRQILEEIE